jgi:hypothetical protein
LQGKNEKEEKFYDIFLRRKIQVAVRGIQEGVLKTGGRGHGFEYRTACGETRRWSLPS